MYRKKGRSSDRPFAISEIPSHILVQGGIVMNHEIHIENQSQITVSAVSSIDGFDENCIFVNLNQDGFYIYGNGLHIEGLDLEAGILTAAGKIESIVYAKKKTKKSFRERFLK